ncbi:MAG: MmgE/PrpD family protein [Chloroflexota bacterium]
MTVSEELAKYAMALTFSDLSAEVVREVKRSVLDMFACAIGGCASDSGNIARDVMVGIGGREESTVIGSKIKLPCANAALANGVMVRYLDYNDTFSATRGDTITGFHPNELIPAALAVGERQNSSGKNVITAIALGYELAGRFIFAENNPLGALGWHYSTSAGYVIPLYVGKLLGLSREQLVNAVGISGTGSTTLGIIDATGEEYNMTKNMGVPHVAQNSIIAALLACQGFTGPSTVIEGKKGFVQSVTRGDYKVELLTDCSRNCSMILQAHKKNLAADHTTQGALNAVLRLVNDYNIMPEQVKSVSIQVSTRSAEHTGDPVKRYPQNKETADHSLYYLTAIAIIDRAVGPQQFTPDRYTNPRVINLIDRITVTANPELNGFIFAGIATIVISSGHEYTCRVDYPRGHSNNPLNDVELARKFEDAAQDYLVKEQIERIIDTTSKLETVKNIGQLMKDFSFDLKHSGRS